jgi:anaerobic magnesium-protoporphyrin IX monomethyl ester cyclase
MKITLISTFDDISSNGLRVISAYLKKHGHNVDLIFLNVTNDELFQPLGQNMKDDLIGLCESSDLVGISLMTNQFFIAKELTEFLKSKISLPVIWGGIHPTVKPEECLEYADMVCIGEGEEAMLELAETYGVRDISRIKNIWTKKEGNIIKNNPRHLEENLDNYPFQDYAFDSHYILREGRIVKMTKQILRETMQACAGPEANIAYSLITTRNCPHNCTYCCNNALRRTYMNKGKFVRKRSSESIMKELEFIKVELGFIGEVHLADDTFFIRSKEEIEEFCSSYKARINLPFKCCLSPQTADREKLRLLVDAGLIFLNIGVQSYNDKTLFDIYKRPTPKTMIMESINTVNEFRERVKVAYHVIVDNPYETKESRKETVRFIGSLPAGSQVYLYPLVFYPGTELYERAKGDGFIRNEYEDIYRKFWTIEDIRNCDYLTFVLYVYVLMMDIANKFSELSVLRSKGILEMITSDVTIMLLGGKYTMKILLLGLKMSKRLNNVIVKRFIRLT